MTRRRRSLLALAALVPVAVGGRRALRRAVQVGARSPEERSIALRRKIAVATWSAPREGRLMTRIVIDAEPILDYVARQRANGVRLTAMHVLGAAAGRALAEVPAANARVLAGRVVPFATCDVGFAVDVGRGTDLAPVRVTSADLLSPAQIGASVRAQVDEVRAGQHAGMNRSNTVAAWTPTLLMRPLMMVSSVVLGGLGYGALGQPGSPLGAVFISNVAALGIDEVLLAPVPFARANVYIALGRVREVPVVRDGAVTIGKQIILSITGDHRLGDGVQSALFFHCLTRHLADPDLLDPQS